MCGEGIILQSDGIIPHSDDIISNNNKITLHGDGTTNEQSVMVMDTLAFNMVSNAGLSSCPSVRVTCPFVCVSWTGLSSVRLTLGLQEGKLGVTSAYVADTSHSKWASPKLEYACPGLQVIACKRGRAHT